MDLHIREFQDKDLSIKLEINSSFSPFKVGVYLLFQKRSIPFYIVN